MNEKWAYVGTKNRSYYVSNYGRVKSLDKYGNEYYLSLKPSKQNGYVYIRVFQNFGSRLLHVWVAKLFVPGYREELEVNHKDGDRTNNLYTNLEWVTRVENIRDTIKRGTHDCKTCQEKQMKPCMVINLNTRNIRIYKSAQSGSLDMGHGKTWLGNIIRGYKHSPGIIAYYVDKDIVQELSWVRY